MDTNHYLVFGTVAGLLVLGGIAPCLAVDGQSTSKILEQHLRTPAGNVLQVIRSVTTNGCRIAWIEQRGAKVLVIVDGQRGPEYDGIRSLVFSPDGKRLAYAARKGDKCFVIIDGEAGPEYDGTGEGSLIFSSDGKRLTYVAQKGDKCSVVIDGQSGAEYDEIVKGSLVLSPDGKRVAHGARKGDKWYVIVDGQSGLAYEGIVCGPVFLKDGTVEYIVMKGSSLYRVQSKQ